MPPNAPDDFNHLRLFVRAYADGQPTPEKRAAMGAALVRYLTARRLLRRTGGGDGPIAPIRAIDRVR